jgi:intracellular sulfur oxidation DsrE/DsrF family protein
MSISQCMVMLQNLVELENAEEIQIICHLAGTRSLSKERLERLQDDTIHIYTSEQVPFLLFCSDSQSLLLLYSV